MDDVNKIKRTGGFRRKVEKYLQNVSADNNVTDNISSSMSIASTTSDTRSTHQSDSKTVSRVEATTSGNLIVCSDNKEVYSGESSGCQSDSDVEEIEHEDRSHNFRTKLQEWSVNHGITHRAINGLLPILNELQPNLVPKDARTLLKSVKTVHIQKMTNGEYWHHGLKINLEKYFQNLSENTIVHININIDGLPTYKSSKTEFWPILANIHEMPSIPVLIIGIYCGSGKPSDANEFLLPFVTETMEIIQTPLEVNDHLLEVHIRAIICDSPARAYIKGIANFNSQNGCPKCTTIGEYSYVSHCNVFPRHDCPQRTNEEFRDKKYGSHHKMDSALIQLPIDMILDFPVADSLHLIDLGVMKRCLMGWRDGSFTGYLTKWRAAEIASISQFLLQCKLPQEIHRSVRGLDTLAFWKATEFRSFIYYLGIVVLKKYLQPDAYDHFLLLFCAVTICSTEAYSHLLPIAQSLFSTYIEYYRDIYGEAHMTSNVHNLCHVVEEVKRFGVLTSFNAYPFENTLYQIKRLLRTGYKPLQQAAKRIMEKNYIDIYARQTKKLPAYPRPKKIIMVDNFDYDVLDAQTDKSQITFNSGIEFQDYSLSNDRINCWFLTNDNCIAKFECLVNDNKQYLLYGKNVNNRRIFFERPIKSSHLNIFVCELQYDEKSVLYRIEDIKCKLVSVNYESNKTVFIPLIHTLKH